MEIQNELEKKSKPTSLLKTKRYALYWISSLLSNIGTWMQQVAQPWVILTLSHSSFYVGLDSFAMNAPSWIFTLWGGLLADNFSRKKIVLICQSIQFFCVLLLFVFIITGKIQIWLILLISFLIGTTDSLSMPAFQSIIPSLVSDKDLSRAISFNSVQFNLSRILGPAIAGVVITIYGASVCYGANLISYIPFFLSLLWIYPRESFKTSINKNSLTSTNILIQFKEIVLAKKYQIPLGTLIVTTFFCSPLIVFSSVLIKEVFHGSAEGLGWMMSAFGVGGILGAIVSSFTNPKIIQSQYFTNILAVLFGLTLILASFSTSLTMLVIVFTLAGAFMTASNTSVNTRLQSLTKNEFRGRIASLFQLALNGGLGLGSLLTGLLSSTFGINKILLANGITAAALQIYILSYYKKNKSLLI